jgi:HEAT repeat protein
MDISAYLKQQWQDDHAEEYTNGMKDRGDYAALIEALANHPSERVRRAALKAINSLDFTTLDGQVVDRIEESISDFLARRSQLYSLDFVDAAGILAKIKRPRGIGYLISYLEKPETQKTYNMDVDGAFDNCCRAIGEAGIDFLANYLAENKYCVIERTLVRGLYSIGGERAHDALVVGLKQHCETYQVFNFNNIQAVSGYVAFINKLGAKPNDLEVLKTALEAVKKAEIKHAEELSHIQGPLLGNDPYGALDKQIQDVIQKIEAEAM